MMSEVPSLIQTALWIPALPLLAYVIQSFFGKHLPRMGDWVSTGAIFISFLLACKIFVSMISAYDPTWSVSHSWTWISLPGPTPVEFKIGVQLDNIAAIMLLMVTLCATLIHLFSTAYMRDHHGKPEDGYRYASFFSFLSLFTASMLGLIISDNLLTLFMCWELMGLCSYLLIGFYRNKPSAANASLKAFMTTRVGDAGLFLALLVIFAYVGSFRFADLYEAVGAGYLNRESIWGISLASIIGFGIFLGTVGKSAQFPLHVWLPDAMEGPTPVSALIHAATMVAAGVYLIIRVFPVLDAGGVLPIVAYVGAITALFAAILAIKQNDIKKVLAYSTLSQLGYMVMAVGLGAFTASFFHLITHAVFKACLFMCSGAVIYAMHHEQDMRNMGGLRKKLPITFACMLIATMAIAGVPGLSGFLSKDSILASAYGYGFLAYPQHAILPILAFLTAGITAFYMFRLIFMTFFGKPHDQHHFEEAHEGGWNMTTPLIVLAVLSFGVFYSGSITGILKPLDMIFGGANQWFETLVRAPQVLDLMATAHSGGVVKFSESFAEKMEPFAHTAHTPAMILSIIIAGIGIFFSYLVFGSKKISADRLERFWPRFVQKAVDNLYYFDQLYIGGFIKKVLMPFASKSAKFDDAVIDRVAVDGWKDVTVGVNQVAGTFDDVVVDGVFVDGVGGGVPNAFGATLRSLQNGRVQRYLIVAVAALMLLFFVRGVL